jgi:hypothetical protein
MMRKKWVSRCAVGVPWRRPAGLAGLVFIPRYIHAGQRKTPLRRDWRRNGVEVRRDE